MDQRVRLEQQVSPVRLKIRVLRVRRDLRELSQAQQEQRVRKIRDRLDRRVKLEVQEQQEQLLLRVRWEFPVLLDQRDSLQAQPVRLDCVDTQVQQV
uniref:Uncharacterized protein n=1 Tax=viral metagenome TaxID=1070528 RepID=A0A6C0J5W4_9ZZZZ